MRSRPGKERFELGASGLERAQLGSEVGHLAGHVVRGGAEVLDRAERFGVGSTAFSKCAGGDAEHDRSTAIRASEGDVRGRDVATECGGDCLQLADDWRCSHSTTTS
jgi:hypothetical protein